MGWDGIGVFLFKVSRSLAILYYGMKLELWQGWI